MIVILKHNDIGSEGKQLNNAGADSVMLMGDPAGATIQSTSSLTSYIDVTVSVCA